MGQKSFFLSRQSLSSQSVAIAIGTHTGGSAFGSPIGLGTSVPNACRMLTVLSRDTSAFSQSVISIFNYQSKFSFLCLFCPYQCCLGSQPLPASSETSQHPF